MQIVRGLPSYPPDAPAAAIALGVFDGVHLAHRAILECAVSRARAAGFVALVCTFDPHPLQVLQPERAPVPITTLDERLGLLAETGLDTTVVVAFTPEFAAMEPEAFVKEVLVDRLRAREVVVGFNHTFGRGARGDTRLLERVGAAVGVRTHVIPPLLVDGRPVSSSAIRAALAEGAVERATRYLGRPYALAGEVVPGAGRGRSLGFPTANLRPDRPPLLPAGVYACQAVVEGTPHPAVVNIGVRPTFGEGALAVEAHLLDFEGLLYGSRVRLAFVARLREERRFPGPAALREQIARDVAAARARL
jgi:riboflavin kinase / FMN adenylyltransferase